MKPIAIAAAAGVLSLAMPLAAAPGDMTVATFLAKADALRSRGPLALMSSDYSLLKGEVTGAAQAYRARLRGEQAAGRPSSCPPAGRAAFNSDDVIGQMRTYPVGARGQTTVATAVADLFRNRYPCPAR